MLDPETIRILAEADETLRVVRSHEPLYIAAILALAVISWQLIRVYRRAGKRKERVFRELF